MSGFLAIRSERGPVDRDAVDAILRASAHRGHAREWTADGITMVAFDGRRGSGLAVTDDFVVACDARIDNRAEVDGWLGFAPQSDAERLAHVWRRNGLTRVIGDFAGAVWDRKRKELSIFRDPCAGRGALLGRSRTGALAASSLPMLLADSAMSTEIDGAWVHAYLTGESGFARATGYTNIERLEPGSIATPGWRQHRYFEWSFARTRERDDAAYAERLRELLIEATRARIDGARRIGVSLSGGLDSTSVAAAARAARPDAELVALSVPFMDPKADERHEQRAVAEHLGMTLRWAPLGASPFGSSPEATIAAIGTPPVAPNQFFIDAVVEAGADERIDVALDGIDGDSLLAGNWWYLADLFATARFRTLSEELKAAAARHGVSRKEMFSAAVTHPLRRAPFHAGRLFAREERTSLSPGILPVVVETIAEQWARAGVEAAHPFLDRRVVEFCLGLPREQKIRLGVSKVALRTAMAEPLLPAAITEKTAKAELGGSLLSALSTGVFHTVETGLQLCLSNSSPWVEPVSVARATERFRRGTDTVQAFRLAFVGYWRARLNGGVHGDASEHAKQRDLAGTD